MAQKEVSLDGVVDKSWICRSIQKIIQVGDIPDDPLPHRFRLDLMPTEVKQVLLHLHFLLEKHLHSP